jgi:sarcosine oxidase subunit beta
VIAGDELEPPAAPVIPAQPLPARAEIAILGAGIMGLSIAYQLARRGVTDIVVIDRGYLASGASGRNGGGIRQQWSTELNIRLMQRSVALCQDFATELGVNVWFRQGGYLFLARNGKEVARLEKNIALQNRCGVATRMIDPAAARAIVPELDLAGIVAASYNASDGIVFPWPFLWGYARRAAAKGVAIHTHTPVVGLEPTRPGYTIVTPRGRVAARRVVCAVGSWTPDLARMIGLDVPTFPIRHEICSSEPLKPFLGPMVSELTSGLYCSQSMRGEIVGGVSLPGHGPARSTGPASPDRAASRSDAEVRSNASSLEFLATYARRLTRLMPVLRDIKILRAWAGPYDGSPDGNPILDAPPEHPDFFLACGFVGHGFMMAPVVGELYAEYLTGGARHELFARSNLSRFRGDAPAYEREDFNIG